MRISCLGHSCFRIEGDQAEIVTDPFTGIGLPEPEAGADLVLCSHEHRDHSHVGNTAKPNAKVLVSWTGETIHNGVRVKGISSYHDRQKGQERGENSIYVFEMDDMCLCHLGDLGHPLGQDIVDAIGEVDVLFVPVGGFYTIGPKMANGVCRVISPRIVIPMHYRTERHSTNFNKLHTVEDFLELRDNVIRLGKAPLDLDEEDLPHNATVVLEA